MPRASDPRALPGAPLGGPPASGAHARLAGMKVLLADDQRLLLDGIRRALEEDGGFEIVGESQNGAQVLPLVGGLISGHHTAYRYLPKSVANFPAEPELARRMTAAGFADVRWDSLTLGIAAIHVGTKR